MVRDFRRSIYDELDELKASMDYLYQLAFEPADNPLLPPGDSPDIAYQYVRNLNAEVTLLDDEVAVTVDTVPGRGKSRVSVDLIDKTTLRITCDCQDEERDGLPGNPVREQRWISLGRVVPLPVPVMKTGARLNLRHGVLDIHLKRCEPAR